MSPQERFRAMGCDVVVAPDNGADVQAVRRLFSDADRRFTRFRPDSELMRVNEGGSRMLVSEPFARALDVALHAARQTDGLVDPTLLPALEDAGYDRDFAELGADPRPPGPGQRGRAREVRLSGRLLTRPAGIRLDLNGVVKSLAVDDAVALVRHGWVSAGGDVATTRPLEVALPGGGSVRLEKGGLATSGLDRRWLRGGVQQHHLIDPRTGLPAQSPWAQVTVCGATCVMADVAAKAALLKGPAGPDWLDEHAMPGRFVAHGGSIVVNDRWRAACT